jgi:hypothetical protein
MMPLDNSFLTGISRPILNLTSASTKEPIKNEGFRSKKTWRRSGLLKVMHSKWLKQKSWHKLSVYPMNLLTGLIYLPSKLGGVLPELK